MASRVREYQAQLARLQRAADTLKDEAAQPFLTPETQTTFTSAASLLGTKITWLQTQIEAETAAESVTETA